MSGLPRVHLKLTKERGKGPSWALSPNGDGWSEGGKGGVRRGWDRPGPGPNAPRPSLRHFPHGQTSSGGPPKKNSGFERFQPVGLWTGFRMGTDSGFEWKRRPVSNGKGVRFHPPEPRTCLSHAPLPRGNIKTTEKHRRRAVSARGVVDRVSNGNGFRFRMGTAPGFEWEGCPVSNGPGNAVSNGGMAVSNGGHPVSNDSGKPGFECFGRFLNAAFLGAGGDPPAG